MSVEASPLPISLLSRLDSDRTAALSSLSSAPLPESVSLLRSTTDRHLLSITHKAISTVDDLLSSGDPKIRLAAASRVLDSSPATKPSPLLSQESSLPLSALRPLFEGLGSLFSALRADPSPTPYPSYTQPEEAQVYSGGGEAASPPTPVPFTIIHSEGLPSSAKETTL